MFEDLCKKLLDMGKQEEMMPLVMELQKEYNTTQQRVDELTKLNTELFNQVTTTVKHEPAVGKVEDDIDTEETVEIATLDEIINFL